MTLREGLRAILRRWYVFVMALLVAGLLVGAFWADSGVYSTRTIVAFTYPHESTLTPDNATSNESVIAFAGAVASAISPNGPPVKYSMASAPIYGAGLREGVVVGLHDDGSQWAPSFGSAMIEIRIVGATEAWVTEQQTAVLESVVLITAAMQDELAVDLDERITARVEPLSMAIEHITPSRIAQLAAVGAMTLAGSIAGTWAAISLERWANREPRRASDAAQVPG